MYCYKGCKSGPSETKITTSQLCLKIFSAIGVDIKTYDIDIAHRVTPRHAAGAEG